MQYFLPEHYAAFTEDKAALDTESVRIERERVSDRLMGLDNALAPYIESKGWDLHPHYMPQHRVSSTHFVFLEDGTPVVNRIPWLWLHYGKSREQLNFLKLIGGYDYKKYDDTKFFNAFYLHTRIQFSINVRAFRCWVLLATDKNYYDRSEFLRRLRDPVQQQMFFNLMVYIMDKGYFYEIDGVQLPIRSDVTLAKFLRFVNTDRHGVYSGIVKEYQPDDERISQDNIVMEMRHNLDKLYPLYDFMAWRPRI